MPEGWAILLGLVGFVIGVLILHWIIRTAVSGGMKDFERWKREQG
jgi:hypothetical protein